MVLMQYNWLKITFYAMCFNIGNGSI